MEQHLLQNLQRNIAQLSDSSSLLRSLGTARSLIANPHSSDSTRRAVVEALVRFLGCHRDDGDTSILRHALSLLAEFASLLNPPPTSLPAILSSVLTGGKHIAADALALLVRVAECGDFGVLGSVLDEELVISLASSRFVSVRAQILDLLVLSLNADRGCGLIRPRLMVQLLLGLAEDLYPSIRRVAIDGLYKQVGTFDEREMIECCYELAVALLDDEEELVRVAATRLVSECGRTFAMNKEESNDCERMDGIFVQLCSVARDMSVKVRIEAFAALGKFKLVSESVLLQSLHKKVSGIKSGKKPHSDNSSVKYKFSLSRAAGAFVHGIEDEFCEVRAAACNSLGMLTVYSVQFAKDALNLLMDMLNDDIAVVRLQTLRTLFHMATYNRLKVQEKHMHMFLGLLADNSVLTRHGARKLLHLMKLPTLEIFLLTFDALVTNMETYPEEEEDIFHVLFFMGKNHGKYATKLSKELVQKMMLSCAGELSLDKPRMIASLVLVISSCLSNEKLFHDIPAAIFSYAIAVFGRISCLLRGVIDEDSLLAYLFHHSHMPSSALQLNLKENDFSIHTTQGIFPKNEKYDEQTASFSCQIFNEMSEINWDENILAVRPKTKKNAYLVEEFGHSVKLILERLTETWPLIQSQHISEVKKILSGCKEELEMIAWNVDGSDDPSLAFASQYVLAIWLFAEIWEQLPPRMPSLAMTRFNIILDKLDMCLKKMRYCFRGMALEEESHILELILLSCILRQSKSGTCSDPMLKKMQVLVSHLELLSQEGSFDVSDLTKQLKRYFSEGGASNTSRNFPDNNLSVQFNLKQMRFSGHVEYIKAEVQQIDSDSENPLPFIFGLPVGIKFLITLFNSSKNDRLWLRMAVGDLIEYIFLDLDHTVTCGKVRKCKINMPFYSTPNAANLVLKACIVMECPLVDGAELKEGWSGPKCEVVLLCEEKDIYLVKMNK